MFYERETCKSKWDKLFSNNWVIQYIVNFINIYRFNLSKIPKSDPTLDAKNHKYGRETMCLPHPCVKE